MRVAFAEKTANCTLVPVMVAPSGVVAAAGRGASMKPSNRIAGARTRRAAVGRVPWNLMSFLLESGMEGRNGGGGGRGRTPGSERSTFSDNHCTASRLQSIAHKVSNAARKWKGLFTSYPGTREALLLLTM